MRILMLAPQPFLEERGAPFAIYHHIKVLLEMGFQVDLVTYHIGKDVSLPGLRLFRVPALPFIRKVKVGPSLAKIPLDILLTLVAIWRLCTERYMCIHSHEEAGLPAIFLSKLFGCRHLYYMHSDLSEQLVSSEFIEHPWLVRIARYIQAFMARYADAIIAICPDIEQAARHMAPHTPVYMIENSAVDESLPDPDAAAVARLRLHLGLGNSPVLLYTGTLECYQGIDLLLHSVPAVHARFPEARYVIVGGNDCQVAEYKRLARKLGVEDVVHFVGQRPLEEMPLYMNLGDILLSPRSKGNNTPLKLYTYLRSGKPILATNIFSQTQVLTSEIAMLVEPDAQSLAAGTIALLDDPNLAKTLGAQGQQFADDHYSWPAFFAKSSSAQLEFSAIANTALV